MANFSKTPSGRWKAQVYVMNKRTSKTFDTKFQAQEWAKRTELDLRLDPSDSHLWTMEQLLEKYRDEVSIHKKGHRWEKIRINKWINEDLIAGKLSELTSKKLIQFRDTRLNQNVSTSTVRRELKLMNSIFNHSIKEWQMMSSNPLSAVSRPPDGKPRDKLISDEEIALFLAQIPYTEKDPSMRNRAGTAFLFAIETGMRAGEICKLRRSHITGNVAKLYDTKNGSDREVPLSKEALRLLALLPDEEIFNLTPDQLDHTFRDIRDEAKLDFVFHDTRHKAVTNLSRKIDVLPLARIIGHSNPKMLLRYYNPETSDLAKLLD
jgi:integrase